MINHQNQNAPSFDDFQVPLPPADCREKAKRFEESDHRRSADKPHSPPMPPLEMAGEDYEWRILL